MSTHAATTPARTDPGHAAGHVDAQGDIHHDSHGHSPHLAHHFDTTEQQISTGKLGMWCFLATEILMFGGLFVAYAVYRHNHPDVFLFAHKSLNTNLGAINTVVLLLSSFTMAMAVRAAAMNNRKQLKMLLILTFLGGIGFMGIKSKEYYDKWNKDLFPGAMNVFNTAFDKGTEVDTIKAKDKSIDYIEAHGVPAPGQAIPAANTGKDLDGAQSEGAQSEGAYAAGMHSAAAVQPVGWNYKDPNAGTSDAAKIVPPQSIPAGMAVENIGPKIVHYSDLSAGDRKNVNTFFSIYFMMTGLHAIHVIIGMGVIAWLYFRANEFSSEYFAPVDLGGLYWHLVDLVWIFLFPLLYLIH